PRLDPAKAVADDTVTITFSVSEPLSADPAVTVAGNAAGFVSNASGDYTYEYTVQASDSLGMADVEVSGSDMLGNPGNLSSSVAFEVDGFFMLVPLYGWPMVAALLAVVRMP
ncbi:hypothetical protein ACFL1X_07155, partial [Candidatus Hydrogenedentota bacterium]